MTHSAVFQRIVCGIDGTPESLEAVRQAVALAPPDAHLHLFHAVDLGPALSVAWAAPELAPAMSSEGSDALDAASALAPGASTSQVDGPAATSLLEELERADATLVVVGSHGIPRAEGILLGTTATRMLHDAPCAVLVARAPEEGLPAGRGIVVGVDGSPQSELAMQVAFEVGERRGAPVRGLVALQGKDVRLDTARALLPEVAVDRAHSPVDALVAATKDADLLVVGSRGLHGLRALGSVSERAAHQAPCSVLVVRPRG